MCRHLREIKGSPIDSYWVFSQKKCFKQRTRVSHNTFKFLCARLGPYLQRKNTSMREAISSESKVAISLQMLGTRRCVPLEDVYGVAE